VKFFSIHSASQREVVYQSRRHIRGVRGGARWRSSPWFSSFLRSAQKRGESGGQRYGDRYGLMVRVERLVPQKRFGTGEQRKVQTINIQDFRTKPTGCCLFTQVREECRDRFETFQRSADDTGTVGGLLD